MKRNDIDITISIMCKVQSILHDLDDLSHSVRYRQEFKNAKRELLQLHFKVRGSTHATGKRRRRAELR